MQIQQPSSSFQHSVNPQQHQLEEQQQHWSSEAYPSDSNISEGSTGGETQSQLGQNLTPPQPACSPIPQHQQLQRDQQPSCQPHHSGCHQHQPYHQVAQQQYYCPGCGIKAPMTGSATCSRRCTWLCNHQCPQCGKPKPDGFVYCSRTCSYQSTQANWCSACGVCQTDLSGFCVNLDCVGAQPSHQRQQFPAASGRGSSSASTTSSGTPPPEMMMLQQQAMMMGPVSTGSGAHQYCTGNNHHHTQHNNQMVGVPGGRRGSNSKMECRVMNTSEISRSGIPSVFSAIFAHGLGTRLVSVLKLTSSAIHRKRYLSYRSIVENQMASVGASKYGHGGEGNEQRRYFGIPLRCNLGRDVGAAAPLAPPSAIGGGSSNNRDVSQQPNLRTCHDHTCVACSVLTKGLDLYTQGVSSHYCSTTSTAAVQYLEPSPTSGLKAMMVARVVVGNPEVHYVDQNTEPPFIQAPQDPAFNHSMILTNNDTNYDGTYIFSDEAVDPQYLVLFE